MAKASEVKTIADSSAIPSASGNASFRLTDPIFHRRYEIGRLENDILLKGHGMRTIDFLLHDARAKVQYKYPTAEKI